MFGVHFISNHQKISLQRLTRFDNTTEGNF